jgi:CrcB protein
MIKFTGQMLVLALGGGIGTLLRVLIYYFAEKQLSNEMPYGTILVNVIGSLVIGLLWGIFEKNGVPPTVKAFMFIGILGGFTTFTTFALDSFNILQQGKIMVFGIYFILNNFLGISACFIGYYITKFFTA